MVLLDSIGEGREVKPSCSPFGGSYLPSLSWHWELAERGRACNKWLYTSGGGSGVVVVVVVVVVEEPRFVLQIVLIESECLSMDW